MLNTKSQPIDLASLKGRVQGVAILLDSAPRNWASMEEVNCRLARALTSAGITVVLVYAKQLPPEIDQRMRDAGAHIEVLPYGTQRYRYLKGLRRIVDHYSISMVHVCFFDYFSFIPWIARLAGVRHVLYEELNSGMLNATGFKQKLLQMRTKIMTRPVQRFIAVSGFVKDDLIKRGVGADLIDVRYLAADEQRFQPDPAARARWVSEYAIGSDELIMSTVTLLRPFKSPETLVEASAVLAERGVRARLFVAGDGAMLSDLKELSKKLNVEDRIHWLGFCKDPANLLQASDVFLLASVGEAGGFVLSEAMGCGTPIIGSRSGVIIECVEDGTTGLLATPKDANSFADAIEKIWSDARLLQSMSINSRSRMLERFTTDLNVQGTIRTYGEMLNQ